MKKAVSLLIALVFSLGLCVNAVAAEEHQPTPYLTYIQVGTFIFDVEDGTAILEGDGATYASTGAKARLTFTLQKKVNGYWEEVDTWSKTSTDHFVGLSKAVSVDSGYSYRGKFTVSAVIDGRVVESASEYSNAKWY